MHISLESRDQNEFNCSSMTTVPDFDIELCTNLHNLAKCRQNSGEDRTPGNTVV